MPLCCSSVLRIVKLSLNTFLLCVTPSASIPMCDCSDPHLNSYEHKIPVCLYYEATRKSSLECS